MSVTYKKPCTVPVVDIELVLKAGHSVESAKEMQSWANAGEASKARVARTRHDGVRLETAMVW